MVKKKISVKELCNSIHGAVRILGTDDRYVAVPSPINDANRESVSFCSVKTKDALGIIRNSKAGVIICFNGLAFTGEDYRDRTLILVANPRLEFIRVMRDHFENKVPFGIHPAAVIDEGAEVHPEVYIGPHCYIGRCRIGKGSILYGNMYIYSNVMIGKNVTIHAGTVIGSDGFSYERNEKGELEKFPHIGGVVIEDDVEIGSNVSIDRGTIRDTVIGQGTKVDNLCHIAHNVTIGKHCMIIAQSMIGGSTKIGDFSQVSPCACLRDGIGVGNRTLVGMGSVVTKSIGDGLVVFGVPARERPQRT